MIGETAQLIVDLTLRDQMSAGVGSAQAKLRGLESSAISAGNRGLGSLGVAAGRAGGALSHAGSQIGGVVRNMGMLAGAAGMFGVAGALGASVTKAQDFGAEVRRLTSLTGSSAEVMSTLAAGLDHFGIGADTAQRSIGFLEKNVGLLAAKKDGIVKFQKEFGFQILDSNGKIKDANALILTSADYFTNKAIPATEKAAAMSKLYGRSWQDLLPALTAGRTGIAAAEEEAQRLGLTLTSANMGQLVKMRDATRLWGDALGGLELQIGLTVIPALTDLAGAASKFVGDNRTSIVRGFQQGVKFAEEFGGVITGTVIPAIGWIGGEWNKLPKPLRDLLVGGFVAQKASKWLLGSGPLDWAKGLIGVGGKAVGGALGGIGGIGVTHVWVDNMGMGKGGGSPLDVIKTGAGPAAAETLGAAALGLTTLVAGIVAPLVMFDVIPKMFPGGAQKGAGAGSQTALNTRAGEMTPLMNAQMTGLMPGFQNLAAQAGATHITGIGNNAITNRLSDKFEGVARGVAGMNSKLSQIDRGNGRIVAAISARQAVNVNVNNTISVSVRDVQVANVVRTRYSPMSAGR